MQMLKWANGLMHPGISYMYMYKLTCLVLTAHRSRKCLWAIVALFE